MKTLRNFAALAVLAFALALTGLAQTATPTTFNAPDGFFSVALPGTPTIASKTLKADDGPVTASEFSLADTKDGLDIAIVETVHLKAVPETAAEIVIEFNRTFNAEVVGNGTVKATGAPDGVFEIVDINGVRAYYEAVVQGNEVIQIFISTKEPVDAQVPIIQGIAESIKVTHVTATQN